MMHIAPTSSFKRTRKTLHYDQLMWLSAFELCELKWELTRDWQQMFICGNTF